MNKDGFLSQWILEQRFLAGYCCTAYVIAYITPKKAERWRKQSERETGGLLAILPQHVWIPV